MNIKSVKDFGNMVDNYQSNSWTNNVEWSGIQKPLGSEAPMMGVDGLQGASALGESQKSFAEFLTEQVVKVNDLQSQANTAIQKLTTGESKNIHETLMFVEQAELAFKTMNQIRQKVLDAYREVMKMQV